MSDNTYDTITRDDLPGWRARIVWDPYAEAPDGDTYAPVVYRDYIGGHTGHMRSVWEPGNAADISRAWQHFGMSRTDLFERWLRQQGATSVERIDTRDACMIIYDHPAWRTHVGVPADGLPVDLTGERKVWQAYTDGDVFGIVVEQHRNGRTAWDDGTSDDRDEWTERDAVWGFYGCEYAREEATDMLNAYAGKADS